jgi:hypothetical protein
MSAASERWSSPFCVLFCKSVDRMVRLGLFANTDMAIREFVCFLRERGVMFVPNLAQNERPMPSSKVLSRINWSHGSTPTFSDDDADVDDTYANANANANTDPIGRVDLNGEDEKQIFRRVEDSGGSAATASSRSQGHNPL